ncbi:MAG: hypothetical protein JRH11_02380 [Deltaproteobacteria bacterium]|nr:hypothetical protein [Deltaproteobacteria bacterium]
MGSAGCGDDSPELTDSSTRDSGPSDSGPADTAVDSGAADSGTVDTGLADSGPVTCDPTAVGIDFPSREWTAEVVAEGVLVDEPVGVAFDGRGALLFSNSSSWIGAGVDPGDVLEVNAGTLGAFAADDLMVGPGHVAFLGVAAGGFDPGLYLATEDGSAAGGTDSILEVSPDGTTVASLTAAVTDPGEVEFGTGGDFGDDLYVTTRERDDSTAPNARTLVRVASDGTATAVDVVDGSTAVTGAWSLEFGPGGALGTDLFLGTIDDSGFSPGSMDAIYRVRASDGRATVFSSGIRPRAMAAPAPTSPLAGAFGEHLYVVTGNTIVRINARRAVETFATGIMSTAGMRFGPDGALYIAQPGAGRVIRVSPCPAM